ncbi:hypothetical protein ALIPUT_02784 [Alistipes putredinis DSM 17216]|uniref:Uncharacterized protein n=1 Tax=Alistipes putredinis DSM 17216 TaxID=445970 RepID=B0N057_9BACT|nr:hypothetical protein ALIPUT_02784 [Alistipes putredinis DSM 17216]
MEFTEPAIDTTKHPKPFRRFSPESNESRPGTAGLLTCSGRHAFPARTASG